MTQLLRLPLISDALDVSGNGHDATLYGAPSFVTDAKFGHALELDGSTQYGQLSASLLNGASAATMACWVYPTRSATVYVYGDYVIVNPLDAGSNGFDILQAPGGLEFKVAATTDGVSNIASFGTLPINTWSHLAAVLDPVNHVLTALLNAEVVNYSYCTGNLRCALNKTAFGSFIDGVAPWQGRLHDLRLYDVALSQPEIAALMVTAKPCPLQLLTGGM